MYPNVVDYRDLKNRFFDRCTSHLSANSLGDRAGIIFTVKTKLKRNNLRLRSFFEIKEDDNYSALYWLPL